jgi:hypothetical protein
VRFLRSTVVCLLAMMLLAGLVTWDAPAGRAQVSQSLARFDVTSITPNVVDSTAATDLTVVGTVTNTSDRPLRNLEAIFQRGSAVDSAPAVQAAVQGDAPGVTDPIFKPLAAELAPGQRTPVTVQVPLRGGASSLQIGGPADYPIMININAEPNGGRARRIYEMRFVLPVLAPRGGPVASPREATPTTLLVPIVDYPRLEQAPVGAPAVLTDDQLATSLAPGGRLDGLVQAVDDSADPNTFLSNAVCFAIDPDLLDTANAMQSGYQVRQPDGSLRAGTGATAARLWLGRLRAAVKGRCVIALPYADADVVALGRAGLPDVIKNSRDGALVIQQMLDVTPRTDVSWPIDGLVDEPAASDLAGQGVHTFLLRPDNVTAAPGSLQPVRLKGGTTTEPTVLPLDPLLSSALDPQNTTALSPAGNGILSVQNTLGALAYRANAGFHPGATAVLAPPRRWNVSATDLHSLFTGLQQLTDQGYLRPTALPTGASDANGSAATGSPTPATQTSTLPEATLVYPPGAEAAEIAQPLVHELAEQNFKVGALFQSTSLDRAANVDPAAVTTPLSDALLRAASSAWRANPGASRDWLNTAETALGTLLSGIGLEQWDGTITLTSSNATIPVWVTNTLPVTVLFSLLVRQQVGLDVKTLGDAGKPLVIPPHSRRPFFLQTTALRAGQFSVDVTVASANGNVELGQTKRLRLENFAYGSLTIPLTVIAAALLVVLSARRITRRIRTGRQRTSAPVSSGGASESAETPPPSVAITMEMAPIERDGPHRVPGDPGGYDGEQG